MKIKEIIKINFIALSIQPLISLCLGMFFLVELTTDFADVLQQPCTGNLFQEIKLCKYRVLVKFDQTIMVKILAKNKSR